MQRHSHSHSNISYITSEIANLSLTNFISDARYDSLPVKEHKMQEESRLLNYLMANYDREVRPVYNASQAVVVRVGITLTQIFDMVSSHQS